MIQVLTHGYFVAVVQESLQLAAWNVASPAMQPVTYQCNDNHKQRWGQVPNARLLLRQDKLLQKEHFQSHSVPLVEFRSVHDAAGAAAAGQQFGFPYMLKSRRRDLLDPTCRATCIQRTWHAHLCLVH